MKMNGSVGWKDLEIGVSADKYGGVIDAQLILLVLMEVNQTQINKMIGLWQDLQKKLYKRLLQNMESQLIKSN
jgi:hypothetical protein